jgi:lipoprotein-anchoring transpeptidase ErfK/SrfK
MRRLLPFAMIGWLSLGALPLAAEPAPVAAPEAAPAAEKAPAVEAVEAVAEPAVDPVAEKPAEPAPPPEPTLEIAINLTTQRLTVTENGILKHTWPVSSGAYGYPTPTGTFRPSWMSRMWYSRQYDNAPMPHSIFFKGGAAIHATSSVHLLGTPASHGCVRLAPSNAAKLYAMVGRHGKERTEISVHGRPKYGSPKIARMRPMQPRYSARYTYGYSPYGASPYAYSAPRYVYPGDAPRYYMNSQKQRAAALKKRRLAVRQYYSGY